MKKITMDKFLSRLILSRIIILLLFFELTFAFADKNLHGIGQNNNNDDDNNNNNNNNDDDNVKKKDNLSGLTLLHLPPVFLSSPRHESASHHEEGIEADLINKLNKWNNNNNNNNNRKEEMIFRNPNNSTNPMNLMNNNLLNLLAAIIPSPEPIHHPCDSLLTQTSEAFSEFYQCSIRYARPYRFCEKCYLSYSKAISAYDQIEYTEQNQTLFDCKKYLLESDNSPVIRSAISNIVTIWNNAYCDNCFTNAITSANDTRLSNSTVKFFKLYKNFSECISLSILHDKPVNICKSCHDSYKSLNHHFNEIEKISSSTVCMDIMDRMNYTRIQWSKTFNCSTTQSTDAVLISAIVTMGVTIPAMFYISTYIASKGVDTVREKFVRRSNGERRQEENQESNESLEENQGLVSPSVSSSQT